MYDPLLIQISTFSSPVNMTMAMAWIPAAIAAEQVAVAGLQSA
jgi:hypothetical protein